MPPSPRRLPPLHAIAAVARVATLAMALLTACVACSRAPDEGEEPQSGSKLSGVLLDLQLNEVSGLAASRQHDDTLWLNDDGDNPPRLFAVDPHGGRKATFRIEGVTKTDWEDVAAFEIDGKHYLLIADTGDNGGLRRTLQLHVVEEPSTLQNARLEPAWSIAFRWPDGARDCEAVAVDPRRGEILLISKKRQPPELFSLPLHPPAGELLTASRLGSLEGMPPPDPERMRQAPSRAKVDGQVTAAALSPDGATLAVMTYRYLLLYPRAQGGNWADAVSRAPRVSVLPWLPQAEALDWTADGRSLYATGEFIPAPLYRITP